MKSTMASGKQSLLIVLALASNFLLLGHAFSPSVGFRQLSHVGQLRSNELVVLEATSDGNKKKKRRRKTPPTAGAPEPVEKVAMSPPEPASLEKPVGKAKDPIGDTVDDEEEVDVAQIFDVANFSFDVESDNGDGMLSILHFCSLVCICCLTCVLLKVDVPQSTDNALPLPDISEVLKKKEMEEELARIEEEKEDDMVKIKRTDRKAFLKVWKPMFVRLHESQI
jgi:hypothetical protein